jgi:nitrate reductase NapE component
MGAISRAVALAGAFGIPVPEHGLCTISATCSGRGSNHCLSLSSFIFFPIFVFAILHVFFHAFEFGFLFFVVQICTERSDGRTKGSQIIVLFSVLLN